MDVSITLDGNNITEYVIEYTREQNICTGVGIFSFLTTSTIPYDQTPWSTAILVEGSNTKGKYIVTDVTEAGDGKVTFN